MKLPKVYEPGQYEPTTYALWETSGAFKPSGQGVPYSIVMPPPNANGNLHIGHALTLGLEDILIRYHRMKGFDTLWIPGADHAGFETWVVYEKQLATEGKSRFDFSREKLYSQVWDFVAARRGDMELQSRAIGASADWDSLVFTLDEKVVKTAYETFKKLWDDKLIYRGERIVNYCTTHQTSFADIEVNHKETTDSIWEIAYKASAGKGEIVVATTRPETLLGDTAIAVHPADERYKDMIGKTVLVPLQDRAIPVVADEAVEKDFGTGAVKVTPAHDPTDFEIGGRHDLPTITVISHDDRMTDAAGKDFAGMKSLDARGKVLEGVKNAGLLRSEKEFSHAVGHCYKCGTRIQPLLKDQWFLHVRPLADRAKAVLENDEITFVPESKKKVLTTYYDNLRDWNLSRQIPWGIPIPAFQNIKDPDDWIYDERVEQEFIEVDGKKYRRDEDTFDTWFSSGQWPFIVTDATEEQGELRRFYPIDVMETGFDILAAWVSRMVMLGVYRTGEIPFKTVHLHGMVNDEKNQKMSKSKGNVINPMEVIATYGSDALRLGIVANRSAGQSQAFSTNSVVAGRNFCNKLWNIARYAEPHIEGVATDSTPKTLADHWVVGRLDTARQTIEDMLAQYRFAEASETVYHVIWDDVADWYLEASKQAVNASMLAYVLETCLKLAHPFAPFVTETIWTTLGRSETLLIRTPWPETTPYDSIAAGEFEQIKTLVTETRYVASELPGDTHTLCYQHDSLIADNTELIARLAKLKAITHIEQPRGLRLAVPNREAWLDIDEQTLYEHQTKLELRLVSVRERINRLGDRLSNASYVEHAPKHIIAQTKTELQTQETLYKRLMSELDVFKD